MIRVGVFEFVVVGLLLVNLWYALYASRKAPVILSAPFVLALGQKEGELIVLRQTVEAARQIIAQLQAQVKAQEEKKVADPS